MSTLKPDNEKKSATDQEPANEVKILSEEKNDENSNDRQPDEILLVQHQIAFREKIQRLSDIELNATLIKKRGFIVSSESNGEARSLLAEQVEAIKAQYNKILSELQTIVTAYCDELNNITVKQKDILKELENKNTVYEFYIVNTLPKAKSEIEEQVKKQKLTC